MPIVVVDLKVGSSPVAGVYTIRNLIDGKRYVGGTVDLRNRLREHKNALIRGNHPSLRLQRAWNRDSEENFCFEVLEVIDKLDDLVDREQHWLDRLDAHISTNGYNIRRHARNNLGVKLSSAAKEKISRAMLGRKFSDETKRKMSAWQQGRKLTPEHIENIRSSLTGHKLTSEHKEKISQTLRGSRRPPEVGRKIAKALKGRKRPLEVIEKMRRNCRPFTKEALAKIHAANVGRKHTKESRQKISEGNKRAWASGRREQQLIQEI